MAVIHLLVEAGANVNAADSALHTVLMEATSKKNLDIVHYLIKAGADVNAKRDDGMNALQIAAQIGSNDIVEFLMRYMTLEEILLFILVDYDSKSLQNMLQRIFPV